MVSFICKKTSCRTTTVIGGFLLFLGVAASSFSPSLDVFFVTYGVIAGFGSALVFTPSYIAVTEYFDEQKGLAMSLSTVGAGLGVVLFSPLIAFLLDFYGFMGCMLVVAALEAHCCVSGILLRPLPNHTHDEEHSHSGDQTSHPTIGARIAAVWTSFVLSLSLFKDMTMVLYSFTMLTLPMAFGMIVFFLPDAAVLIGTSNKNASLLLSAFGLADIIGRLTWGLIFDMHVLRNRRRVLYAIIGR